MPQLGLPGNIRACLFDLDGVLSQTATLHYRAWKQMFDDFLRKRAGRAGQPLKPFEKPDYLEFVDGKPRSEGVSSFLASRAIHLVEGQPDDPPDAETIHGLGNRKNEVVLGMIEREGVEAFEGSRRYLQAVTAHGLKKAVVSASANTRAVLGITGLASMFEVVVDGEVAAREGLRGKPFPDTFLHATRELNEPARAAAVFEDALAGVKAGREGGFGFVVGVDRSDQAEALRREGADVVVKDLAQLLEER